MAYNATVLEVMVASPSDVEAERAIIREVIAEWNVLHARERGTVLLPTGWDTHSSADLAGRPQQIINERILAQADLVIGIFWTRVGTPTGKSVSGTAEEIGEHHKAGKPVMLFFSNAPIPPSQMDHDQFAKVQELKVWAFSEGIVGHYDSHDDFRSKLSRQLHITLRENSHLAGVIDQRRDEIPAAKPTPTLSQEAKKLLIAAAASEQGIFYARRHTGGTTIKAGPQQMCDPGDRREVARWQAAVDEIYGRGFARDLNGKREIFELTDAGYRAADDPRS
jgi:hypothetical protein